MNDSTSAQPLPVMPTVLLLEDNEAYRTLMTEFLTLAGFEVHAAPDGRRVVELLKSRRIDLVITDLAMPERDGIETMTELRYSHPGLPIIAISGDVPLNTHLYLTIAEKLGASRVLAKPFKMDQLVSAAREAVAAGNARETAKTLAG
jgi:CheY-like chemotaxis protein